MAGVIHDHGVALARIGDELRMALEDARPRGALLQAKIERSAARLLLAELANALPQLDRRAQRPSAVILVGDGNAEDELNLFAVALIDHTFVAARDRLRSLTNLLQHFIEIRGRERLHQLCVAGEVGDDHRGKASIALRMHSPRIDRFGRRCVAPVLRFCRDRSLPFQPRPR